MLDLTPIQQTAAAGAQIAVAEAGAVDAAGITLILPGASSASQKKYKRLACAGSIAAGDLVLCVKTSGTWVVLDKIV